MACSQDIAFSVPSQASTDDLARAAAAHVEAGGDALEVMRAALSYAVECERRRWLSRIEGLRAKAREAVK